MAENRYGNDGRNQGSGRSSIFSDDSDQQRGGGQAERSWSPDRNRGNQGGESNPQGSNQHSDDRGFVDRAGDELRSWFGNEEAERRREEDARRYEAEQGNRGNQPSRHDDQWTNRPTDDVRGGGQSYYGQSSNQPRQSGQAYGQSGQQPQQSGQPYGQGGQRQDAGRGQQSYGQTDSYRPDHERGGQDQGYSGAYGATGRGYGQQDNAAYGQSGQAYGQQSRDQQGGQSYGQSSRQTSGQGGQQSYGQGGQQPYGQSGQGFGEGSEGKSIHDANYRQWRDQQIQQLDSEYDEYCRHRQQQFESDFSTFRQSRTGQAGQNPQASGRSGSDTMSAASMSGEASNPAQSTAGTGTASATTASTGGSDPAEAGKTKAR